MTFNKEDQDLTLLNTHTLIIWEIRESAPYIDFSNTLLFPDISFTSFFTAAQMGKLPYSRLVTQQNGLQPRCSQGNYLEPPKASPHPTLPQSHHDAPSKWLPFKNPGTQTVHENVQQPCCQTGREVCWTQHPEPRITLPPKGT